MISEGQEDTLLESRVKYAAHLNYFLFVTLFGVDLGEDCIEKGPFDEFLVPQTGVLAGLLQVFGKLKAIEAPLKSLGLLLPFEYFDL